MVWKVLGMKETGITRKYNGLGNYAALKFWKPLYFLVIPVFFMPKTFQTIIFPCDSCLFLLKITQTFIFPCDLGFG